METVLATTAIKEHMIMKDLLVFLFYYKDGELYWRRKPAITVDISKPAGSVNGGGFREIRINSKRYRTDMLIWIYHNDVLDDESKYTKKLVHLDDDKLNSRIENLALKFK